MRSSWWKILSVLLLVYTIIGGFLLDVPVLNIIEQSIRNLYFHVAMWMSMMVFFIISVVYAVKYLVTQKLSDDNRSVEFGKTGMLFGLLGLVTGMIWATYTWGQPWSNDPKQLGAAIALLIYAAYFVLRNSMHDIDKRARISAVYNIFAFAMLFPTIWVLPRLVESLHPGGEGNPAMNTKDIDNRMRMVFYPAVIGWTLLGVWITTLKIRIDILKEKQYA